jgi:alpha-ribazole phosphatase
LNDPAADALAVSGRLPKFTRIVTSPLRRAAELAKALGSLTGIPVRTEARLQEMDFGRWEGQLWSDIPREELDIWADDLLAARPHGGESVQMMVDRVGTALADHGQADTLFVTHMGVIRSALFLSGAKAPWEAKVDFLGWITLDPGDISLGSPPASG